MKISTRWTVTSVRHWNAWIRRTASTRKTELPFRSFLVGFGQLTRCNTCKHPIWSEAKKRKRKQHRTRCGCALGSISRRMCRVRQFFTWKWILFHVNNITKSINFLILLLLLFHDSQFVIWLFFAFWAVFKFNFGPPFRFGRSCFICALLFSSSFFLRPRSVPTYIQLIQHSCVFVWNRAAHKSPTRRRKKKTRNRKTVFLHVVTKFR